MAEYDFYRRTYMGGSVPPEEFGRLSLRAEEQLARYERVCRVEGGPDARNLAVCAMADALYYFETAQNGGMTVSSSIGSVSASYQGGSVDISPKAQEKELYRCARQYLDIYRGVG